MEAGEEAAPLLIKLSLSFWTLEFGKWKIDWTVATHVYNLAARMRSPDLRWTMGRMTLKCIYTFVVTFSKMEKLVKFLILH